MRNWLALFFSIALTFSSAGTAAASAAPSDRYKVDLLLVVPHSDDELMLGGYLARLSLDEHKRIAVVFITDGDAGGNNDGTQSGPALGLIRQIEARRGLAAMGIDMVWFLGHADTPGQNPLRSLDHWGHGQTLEQIVRIVRVTQPDVIVTWLPQSVAGENHGDHQASGIVATEAFDSAGDPLQFPAQLSPVQDMSSLGNLTEGLQPWQPKKLYFMSDAFEVFSPYWHDPAEMPRHRRNIGDGNGPVYEVTAVSPSRGKTYAELWAEAQALYPSQDGPLGRQALQHKNFADFSHPVRLIFGKSVVGGSVTGDVFEGVTSTAAAWRPLKREETQQTPVFSIGDPWRYLATFWQAHNLEQLHAMIPEPELAVDFSQTFAVPLQVCNHTNKPAIFRILPTLPTGWTGMTTAADYTVPDGKCASLPARLGAPARGKKQWQQLKWTASASGHTLGTVSMWIYLGQTGGLPLQ